MRLFSTWRCVATLAAAVSGGCMPPSPTGAGEASRPSVAPAASVAAPRASSEPPLAPSSPPVTSAKPEVLTLQLDGPPGDAGMPGGNRLTPVNVPTGDVALGATSVTEPVQNADRVVAGLRPGFRTCYRMGLNGDPTMAGKLVMRVTITANGEVSSAEAAENTGISDSVSRCVARKLRNAQFDPPAAKGSVLTIPLTLKTR